MEHVPVWVARVTGVWGELGYVLNFLLKSHLPIWVISHLVHKQTTFNGLRGSLNKQTTFIRVRG